MIYRRIDSFEEYGARVGSFLNQGLAILNPESKSKTNPRFAYLSCSVNQILELAQTGSISLEEQRTYLVLPSEIPPTVHNGQEIARFVIDHSSQTKEDVVVAIANEPPLSYNLKNKLNRDVSGSYLASLDFSLWYYDLAGIEAVSGQARRELAKFQKEAIVISGTKTKQKIL